MLKQTTSAKCSSYDKKYYTLALGQMLLTLVLRSLNTYVWYVSCNQTYTTYVVNSSTLLRDEAIFYMPTIFVALGGIANISMLWSSLEKNFNVRMINFGTLLLTSAIIVLIEIVLYAAYKNDLDSYNLVIECIIGVFTLIILFINCFNDKIKKKPIEHKLFDDFIRSEYDL